jgi:hypothetical protein
MRRLVARIGDGHSALGARSDRVGGKGIVPLRIERFADGIYVTAVPSDLSDLLGVRVLRIGNQEAGAAWRTLRQYESGDNDWHRDSGVPLTLTLPDLVYGAGLSDSTDALALRVVDAAGRERDVTVREREIPLAFDWYYRGRKAPGEATLGLPALDESKCDLPYRNLGVPYWFTLTPDGLLYARINMVLDSREPAWLDGESKVVTLAELTGALMKLVDGGSVKKLVIDLRANGGGNNMLAKPLVDAIAARPSINQRGRLFVMTGRITYSAAMNLVSLLEDRTEAIFVGEPAGGSPHHDGDAIGFVLPNSKLRLRVSTLHWDLGVAPTDVRSWVEPELPAAPRFSELREGRDGALTKIREWTPESQLEDRMLAIYDRDGLAAALEAGTKAMRERDEGMPGAQSLLRFADGVLKKRKSRDDIFAAFRFAAETVPDSVEAWFARGRVSGFVGENAEAEKALARARALAPNNELVRRMHEAYARLSVSAPGN